MYKPTMYIKEYLEFFNIDFEEIEDRIIKYPTYQLLTINNKKYRVFDAALVTTFDLPNLNGLITFNKFHYEIMKPKIDKLIYLPILNICRGNKKDGIYSLLSINNYFEVYEKHKQFILDNKTDNLVIPHYFGLWNPHQHCLDKVLVGKYKRYKDVRQLNCSENFYIIGHELTLDLVPIITHFYDNPDSNFYLLSSYGLEKTFLLDELKLYFGIETLENYKYKLLMKPSSYNYSTVETELNSIFR